MSDFAGAVTPTKFWVALGLSVSLHGAVGAALSLEPRFASHEQVPPAVHIASAAAPKSAAVDGAPIPIEPLNAALDEPSAPAIDRGFMPRAVPVPGPSPREPDKNQNYVERLRGDGAGEQNAEATKTQSARSHVTSTERGTDERGPSRTSEKRTPNEATTPADIQAVDAKAKGAAGKEPPSTPLLGSAATALQPLAEVPSTKERSAGVDRASLHEAMAATMSATHGDSAYSPPVIRVDPQEKNLDRAFTRAFAWAFAVDRSFFATVPTGQARFAITLAEDGRIATVEWGDDRVPARLRELVERMVKLLSVNRFSPPAPIGEGRSRRTFQLVVTESRVSAPPDAPASGKPGDIWMLAAGETPSPGRPSHPSVADVTGHRIHGDLTIVSAL